jgi:nitroreductase
MNELLKIIEKRQSDRIPFDPDRPVSKRDLLMILKAGRWAPTAHNMQNFGIMVVDNKNILKSIENIVYPASFTFIKENYKQLSFSVEELKRKKTGVLGTMFPPAWRKENVTEKDLISEEKNSENSHNQMMPTPLLLLVVYDPEKRAPGSEGDFLGIMSLGCMMENMWLMASSLGIGFHVVSSLSGEHAEKEIKKMLSIPRNLKIAISYRLGYPTRKPGYIRVRREVKDFCHHNKFGFPFNG